jgi:hypothetical protein
MTGPQEVKTSMARKMTTKAASRIQSAADRTGTNLGLKARAQRAAARNKK